MNVEDKTKEEMKEEKEEVKEEKRTPYILQSPDLLTANPYKKTIKLRLHTRV